jgi:hypothetical protein
MTEHPSITNKYILPFLPNLITERPEGKYLREGDTVTLLGGFIARVVNMRDITSSAENAYFNIYTCELEIIDDAQATMSIAELHDFLSQSKVQDD